MAICPRQSVCSYLIRFRPTGMPTRPWRRCAWMITKTPKCLGSSHVCRTARCLSWGERIGARCRTSRIGPQFRLIVGTAVMNILQRSFRTVALPSLHENSAESRAALGTASSEVPEKASLKMTYVCFGSDADICSATSAMSALPSKADMCSARADVR